MASRELGVETLACSNCGAALPVEEQADGSQVAARCSKCYPIKERASSSTSAPREKATNVEEEQK